MQCRFWRVKELTYFGNTFGGFRWNKWNSCIQWHICKRTWMCANITWARDCLGISWIEDEWEELLHTWLGASSDNFCLEIWKHYLPRNRIEIYTDNKSFKYIFTSEELNMRQKNGWNSWQTATSIYNTIPVRLTLSFMLWVQWWCSLPSRNSCSKRWES